MVKQLEKRIIKLKTIFKEITQSAATTKRRWIEIVGETLGDQVKQ